MGVVGIEKDMNILLTHLCTYFGKALGQLGGSRGEGGGKEVWLGWVVSKLMIERIDQLWLYISCSNSSFFVPFGGPSGDTCMYWIYVLIISTPLLASKLDMLYFLGFN